jgi:two-component system, OmpR family, response regulator
MRILLVEDDVRLAAAVRRGLQAEAIVADVVASGEEALWRAAARPYAVLVLDVMLPGLDGVEVCRRLDHKETKVLMLTALGDVTTEVASLEAGARGYLTKPFSSMELLDRVEELLKQ